MATDFVSLSFISPPVYLSVSQTPCPASGGWGWVHKLNPIALICRENELRDGAG